MIRGLGEEPGWATSTWPKRSEDMASEISSYSRSESADWDESFWEQSRHDLEPVHYQEEGKNETNVVYANNGDSSSFEDGETFLGIKNMNLIKFASMVGFGFAIFFCFLLLGHMINWRLKRRSNQQRRYEIESEERNSDESNASTFSKNKEARSSCAKQTLTLQLKKVSATIDSLDIMRNMSLSPTGDNKRKENILLIPEHRKFDVESGQYLMGPKDKRCVPGTCIICLNAYKPGEIVTWSANSECVHAFHQNCILTWLTKTNNENLDCPCCRQSFVYQKAVVGK